MKSSPLRYAPLAPLFLILLFLGGLFLFALIEFGLLQYAYDKLGLSPRAVFAVLLGSLFGSGLNIPVASLPSHGHREPQIVSFLGVRYVVPPSAHPNQTIIAVNVGGCVIPVLLSAFLLTHHNIVASGLVATLAVTVIVHRLARPIPGVGIAMPPLLPPVLAAVIALVVDPAHAPPVAYVAGTMGTLIGADLLNLGKIRDLGAPVASIGGAGTSDGIFLTGIIAVLLA
jgi:uncharacterized membrane protein